MPFISLSRLTMHYEQVGSGETVFVFLHGNFASWRWWQPLLQHLPDGYCAYVPELRGFGDTDHPPEGYTIEQLAQDIDEFVTALHLPVFHLVGHSLGGAVALQFTLYHPTLVHTLMLVSPAPAEGMPQLSKFIGIFQNSYSLLNLFSRPLLQHVLNRMGLDQHPQSLGNVLLHDATRVAPQAVMGLVQSLSIWNVQDQLSRLQLPLLILWGDRDIIIQREALERMVCRLPSAQLIVWPDIGHAPQLEQPELFKKLMLQFIHNHLTTTLPSPIPKPTKWERVKRWWKK